MRRVLPAVHGRIPGCVHTVQGTQGAVPTPQGSLPGMSSRAPCPLPCVHSRVQCSLHVHRPPCYTGFSATPLPAALPVR